MFKKRLTAGAIALLVGALTGPTAVFNSAGADERCTPVAHVLDASQIPMNESEHPDSESPDERYKDKAGVNCIPTYELDFAGALADPTFPKNKCEPESEYDQIARDIKNDPEYFKACKRLKFTMGPLIARPGMNDSLIHVKTFEHPMYNGYTVRWKPGLQSASGRVPLVQDLHLHHGTWIGGINGPTAATGPFFATGEEQTILQFPKGYGWSMQGNSAWIMLYMLHNALPTTEVVYITYDIDFIKTSDATSLKWTDGNGNEKTGLKDVRSIWMDAGSGGSQRTWDNKSQSTSSYSGLNPIFNAQKGKGHPDAGAFHKITGPPEVTDMTTVPIRNNAGTGETVCTFPIENCADFDSKQGKTLQQGNPTDQIIGRATSLNNTFGPCPELGEGKTCSTIVVMGGHVHPGGIRDEVSVKRGKKIVPIHISDAVYWGGDEEYSNQELAGAPATSWDLSMTGTVAKSAGIPGRAKDAWKILVQPGDELILNGVYDTTVGSAYDQMAIVMAWAYPGYEADAIDPFDQNTIIDAGWAEGPALADRPSGLPSAIDVGCTPGTVRAGDADAGEGGENIGKTVLCLRGNVTHGSMPSRQDHVDCKDNCPPLTARRVPLVSNTVSMQAFNYGQMDLALAQVAGIPTVPLGTELRFENPDLAAMIWHTVTACPAPCTGSTSANYPYPAAGDTPVDFDSTIMGFGLGAATAGVFSWEYTPPQKGMYTFFCRIHPLMRGAFEVV